MIDAFNSISLSFQIGHLLAQYQCTFADAEHILNLLQAEIHQLRENIEYESIPDYFAGKKRIDVSHMPVSYGKYLYDYNGIAPESFGRHCKAEEWEENFKREFPGIPYEAVTVPVDEA